MSDGGREAELLDNIKGGLPGEARARYNSLMAMNRAGESLTPEEYSEFARLGDQIENFEVEQAGYLMELARLRGVPVGELMRSLGIGPGGAEN